MYKKTLKFIVFSIFICICNLAVAHTGTGTANGGGMAAGFTHPFLGIDHLLAMLAVGVWAGQNQGKILWAAPLAFMMFMVIGGLLGMIQIQLPITEFAILGSLIVFGSLIALSIKPNTAIAMLLISAFAIFHGHAHGIEMAVTASASQYILGFICATGSLHIIGIAIAKTFLLNGKTYRAKIAGSSIVAAGITLILLS